MFYRSQIIKDIVEENVSLEQSLNRFYLLALVINEIEFTNWAMKELNGYDDTDELPEYRRKVGLLINYSGINGSFKVNNQPLPPGLIKSNHLEMLKKTGISNGIRYISELAVANSPSERDISFLAGEVFKNSDGAIQCFSVKQIIPQSVFQSLCAIVKQKMLQLLITLEREHGNLDKYEMGLLAENTGQSISNSTSSTKPEIILPSLLFSSASKSIQSICQQINESYNYGLYDCAAVMMRRLLEGLLVLTYQKLGVEEDIMDNNGGHFPLDKIIKNASRNKTLSLSINTKRDMDKFKNLGNYSAHKIWYNALKEDIEPHIHQYRTIIEELMYKAGEK